MTRNGYCRTQHGRWHLVLYGAAAAQAAAALALMGEPEAPYILGAVAAFMATITLSFHTLTVRDGAEALEIRFGPLPILRGRIPYAGITEVAPARSSLIDGWGIHWVPFRGLIYNLWGFDCVRIVRNGKVVRVGTDDPAGLALFLKERVGLGISECGLRNEK